MLPASIPSPSSGVLEVGPLELHAYGLMLLLGIAAATTLTGVRWTRLGGDWDLVLRVAMWGVAGGIVGARLYHLATSWSEVPDEWWGPVAIWEGGLGVWGGIAGGVLAGAVPVWRSGESVYLFMDAAAPGLLLAQAIGRLGNYFNQELFGRPTDLPWGLEIDPEERPAEYVTAETFHPTFLYELLWNALGVVVLIWVGRRFRIKPPGLFALYVAWYTFLRFFLELLRVDPAKELGPLRLNAWVSIVVFALAIAAFVWSQRRDFEPKLPGRGRRAEQAPPQPARKMAVPKGRVRHGR
ncbi:MAG TPA: prolipoprotein diacylglyceryl transferase [Gaiellaceae bacterium]|nr:prolipoprotein diacylglyceryl transferase [Gaiellaceae bacterium]